jgi:hypothetical protein
MVRKNMTNGRTSHLDCFPMSFMKPRFLSMKSLPPSQHNQLSTGVFIFQAAPAISKFHIQCKHNSYPERRLPVSPLPHARLLIPRISWSRTNTPPPGLVCYAPCLVVSLLPLLSAMSQHHEPSASAATICCTAAASLA